MGYLAEAARIVKTELPDVTFTIAGEGNLGGYKKLFKKAGYFMVYNRFISDSDVARLFLASSIVVLPYTEGTQTGIISIAATFKSR